MDEIAESIVKPDIAFFLDVPVTRAVERVRKRREERDRYIDLKMQYKLRKEYLDLAAANGGIVISSTGPAEKNFQKIIKIIEKCLEEKL